MEKANTKQVLEILRYALEKSGRELESYLDSVCGKDSPLRREVLDYLEYDDYEGSVFVPASIGLTAAEIPDAKALETRCDLGNEIACGGMGVIFRAYDRNLAERIRSTARSSASAGGGTLVGLPRDVHRDIVVRLCHRRTDLHGVLPP